MLSQSDHTSLKDYQSVVVLSQSDHTSLDDYPVYGLASLRDPSNAKANKMCSEEPSRLRQNDYTQNMTHRTHHAQ